MLSNEKKVVFLLMLIWAVLTVDGLPFSDSRPLRAIVPLKTGFTEFVSWSGPPHNATFNGFSVEVFKMAVQRLPYVLPYVLVPFGNGSVNPSYNDMVDMVLLGKADAIVADITINVERLQRLDFTQPYVQSALVMVTPFKYGRIGTLWDFLEPFTMPLWIAIILSFCGTGFVMFVLESKNPDFHSGQGSPSKELDESEYQGSASERKTEKSWLKRLVNVYWFTSLTLFFSQQESITTHAGRFVTVVWLLVVLIFTSSYTASLASTLSAAQPHPTIRGFEFLLKSDVPIGYQGGSFIQNYLTMLGVQGSRLKSLSTEEQYARALRRGPENGGIGAIIDELPYIQSFLGTECDFTIVGDQIAYFGGFGFAFAKNSSLTNDVSLAILSLAQDGTLQRLKDRWVGPSLCSAIAQPTSQMQLRSFGGLFLIVIIVYGICIIWRVLTWQVKNVSRVRSFSFPGSSRATPKRIDQVGDLAWKVNNVSRVRSFPGRSQAIPANLVHIEAP